MLEIIYPIFEVDAKPNKVVEAEPLKPTFVFIGNKFINPDSEILTYKVDE